MKLRARTAAALAVGLAIAACGDSPTEPNLATSYVLATLNGRPVPAAYDSGTFADGTTTYFRVLARSVVFLSRDSARYVRSTDAVQRRPNGERGPLSFDCTSQRVAYRRVGLKIVLDIEPIIISPGPPFQPTTVVHDTLEIAGMGLVQRVRQIPSSLQPVPPVQTA